MKRFDEELVSGSVVRSIWKLAWPGVTLNLVNGLHGFVDHVLVGRYVPSPDNAANAGIGIAWSVFLVILVFLTSLYHGMNVLIARYAGKRDQETLSNVAYQTFLCVVYALIFVAAPIGYFAAPYLLQLANPGPGVMPHALPYLRVLFTCSAPLFVMLLMTFGMQASGNAKTPLALGILTTILNIVLSMILIPGLGPIPRLGATGAALGTCLAPSLSLAIAIILILRGKMIIQRPPRFNLIPDIEIFKVVARIGLPTGVQAVTLNLGAVFLLRFIGKLEDGTAAQAAYTICYSQLFSFIAWASWGLRNASSATLGQNIGAGKLERGAKAVYVAMVFAFVWSSFIGMVFWLVPAQLLALFGATSEPVAGYGVAFLKFLSFSGIFMSTSLALTGGLIGAGDTVRPMWIAIISQIGVLLGVCFALDALGALTANGVWAAVLLSHMSRWLLTWVAWRSDKWKRIVVEIGPSPR